MITACCHDVIPHSAELRMITNKGWAPEYNSLLALPCMVSPGAERGDEARITKSLNGSVTLQTSVASLRQSHYYATGITSNCKATSGSREK